MSDSFGDWDEMRSRDGWLTAKEAERLLDGAVPVERADLVPLAAELASLAQTYERSPDSLDVRALAASAANMTRLALSDKGDPTATSASKANRPARQASGLPKRRTLVLNGIVAFVATTAGKVTFAAALTGAAATGGLAATDNLPLLQDSNDPPAETVVSDDEITDQHLDEADECEDLEDEAEEACEAAAEAAVEADDDSDDADEVDEVDEVDDADDDADGEDADDSDDAEDDSDDSADADDESDDADADEVDEVDEVDSDEVDEVDSDEVDEVDSDEADD